MCCLLIAAPSTRAADSGEVRAKSAARTILGAAAPRTTLKTIDGESIDLGSLYGKKAVYFKFWATWCVPCRQQMPHFEHAYETAGADLAVIAVDVGFNESIGAIQDYRKKLGIKMPIVMDDGNLGAALHVRVTPTHIVIGRDGRILYVGHLADEHLGRLARGPRTIRAVRKRSRAHRAAGNSRRAPHRNRRSAAGAVAAHHRWKTFPAAGNRLRPADHSARVFVAVVRVLSRHLAA
jgi:thiol-disulfide isomerase/thioredoxin